MVSPPSIFCSVFGYSNIYKKQSNEPSNWHFRRNIKQKFEAYDRRLMLLSACMLFECMASFFLSLKCLANSYFWFPFHQHLFYEHVIPILSWGIERKPPRPPRGHISHCLGIGLFCGYFSVFVFLTLQDIFKKFLLKSLY